MSFDDTFLGNIGRPFDHYLWEYYHEEFYGQSITISDNVLAEIFEAKNDESNSRNFVTLDVSLTVQNWKKLINTVTYQVEIVNELIPYVTVQGNPFVLKHKYRPIA